ncbi:hypothetical protein FAZ19_09375 [Sphingobacterium alkalisoli]|uniref:RNA polymerase sigma-70 region 2 domain-containing protein n=1 Tax=Sphingobacterium alkalisoli TaxID=1874115 RepID=A0A4U0H6A1_9SPHI|nr:hypothetical protein FAZ19_09375 [Sphingobacterium alkalisoli]
MYERYFGLLYRHAYKMLRDRYQAEDVLQDVFQMLIGKKKMSSNYSTH